MRKTEIKSRPSTLMKKVIWAAKRATPQILRRVWMGSSAHVCRSNVSGGSGDNRGSTGNGVCSEHFGFSRVHLGFDVFVLVQGLVRMFCPYH
jgi:hypothetical protein